MPAGFHHDAFASSATPVKAPPIPNARTPTTSACCALTRETKDTEETQDTKTTRHTDGREAFNMPLTLPFVSSVSSVSLREWVYPTSTAAATTVVHKPF